jgi:competence protein ComFC
MKRPWLGGGAPLRFEGQSREIIHKFKYNSQLIHSRFLISEMNKYIKTHDMPEFSTVTMVPLHWYKQWQRGYNQAEILALGVSKELDIPCRKLLKRKHWGSAQARKNRSQRKKNITHLFSVSEKQKPPKGAILLIDDVMTTGATLTACSKALINAGAEQIFVLTAARG